MQDFLAESTYVGIFVFMLATGFGLPLPEELAIVAAGILSAQGHLRPEGALAALILGALFGDVIVYFLGLRIGQGLVTHRRLWMPRVDPARLEQMKGLLDKHGFKVLFVARFLVGLRFPVYLAVGASKMSFRRFFLIDMACASLVVGVFFALSFTLAERYGDVIYKWIRTGEFLVTAVVVLGLAATFFVVRWRRRRATSNAAATPPHS